MKRHFWIPFCILLLTLAVTVVNDRYIDRTVGHWAEETDKAQEEIAQGDWTSAHKRMKKVEKEWHARHTYLHITVTHGNVDAVEELIAQATRYTKQNDEKADNILTRLRVEFADLRESQTFFIGNLL